MPTIPQPTVNGRGGNTEAQSKNSLPSQVEVVVTGFGAFNNFTTNPSAEIVAQLPTSIAPTSATEPTILVRAYPEPVTVSYQHVLRLVPELYETYPDARFFVHVGVGDRDVCTLEQRARSGPYERRDVDWKRFDGRQTGSELWDHPPAEIASRVDVERIVERMTAGGRADVRASSDAGLYLCEFIYFNSMLVARKREAEKGRSLSGFFFHVPPSLAPEDLKMEADTLVQAIREMVAQEQTTASS